MLWQRDLNSDLGLSGAPSYRQIVDSGEGVIYVGLFGPNIGAVVAAYDYGGNLLGVFESSGQTHGIAPMTLGPEGSILLGQGERVKCIADDGTVRWEYEPAWPQVASHPPSGIVYVSTGGMYSGDKQLIALDSNGQEIWQIDVQGFAASVTSDGGPVCVP